MGRASKKYCVGEYYFTLPDSSLPALNLTTFLAAILISFPVCGLRPLRAAREETEKDPKPTSATRSPFFKAPVVAVINASSAFFASTFESSAFDAIASISSALFMMFGFEGFTGCVYCNS